MIKNLAWKIDPAAAYSNGMPAVSRDLKQDSSLIKCKKAYIVLQFQENKI